MSNHENIELISAIKIINILILVYFVNKLKNKIHVFFYVEPTPEMYSL